jgi:uncharacterized membrane protein YeaQ/YmgE (transglycosylase-associated protein family)
MLAECSIAGAASWHEAVVSLKMKHTAEEFSRYERVCAVAVIPGTTFASVTLEKKPGCGALTSDVLHRADAQSGRGVHTAERRESMNFILWLIIGGILGWIASLIMGTDAQQGVFLNIVVGVIGALLAGFLLTPLFGVGTINQNNFSLPALFVSLLGAIVLLAIVNLFRRGTMR